MKNLFHKAVFFTLILNINNAYAFSREGKFYTTIGIGYGMQKNDNNVFLNNDSVSFKTSQKGINGSVGIGYYLLKELRVGVDLFYMKSSKVKKEFTLSGKTYPVQFNNKSMGGFLDLYYDVLTGSVFNPYLIGGVGVLATQYKALASDVTTKKDLYSAAFKVGFGVSYHFAKSYDFDLGYNFVKAGFSKKKKSQSNSSTNLAFRFKNNMAHSVIAGIRYTF